MMGAQISILRPNFFQNGGFPANFVFLDKNFLARTKFSDRLAFRGGEQYPLPFALFTITPLGLWNFWDWVTFLKRIMILN